MEAVELQDKHLASILDDCETKKLYPYKYIILIIHNYRCLCKILDKQEYLDKYLCASCLKVAYRWGVAEELSTKAIF